jgi:diphosphomevalonate decarboxylase
MPIFAKKTLTATTDSFFAPTASFQDLPEKGEVGWKSPSNIALIKYWGKKEVQLPANPSISFTLSESCTTTTLSFERKEAKNGFSVKVFLDDLPQPDFEPKIIQFFKRITSYFSFLEHYQFTLHTDNSFPHSSGIASSASGMSALALCLCSMEQLAGGSFSKQKASFIARLGSGSACRSIYGGLALWGKHHEFKESSDEWAIAYSQPIHPVFQTFQDSILLIDRGQKQVSSSLGHSLMNSNPFSSRRFEVAHENMTKLSTFIANGELEGFGNIVEKEALMLHALMMTSEPYFILFKSGTLQVIEKVWEFRAATQLHLYVTLDAGANVHLLYPEDEKEKIREFIQRELVVYCENKQYICDMVGSGPHQLK